MTLARASSSRVCCPLPVVSKADVQGGVRKAGFGTLCMLQGLPNADAAL